MPLPPPFYFDVAAPARSPLEIGAQQQKMLAAGDFTGWATMDTAPRNGTTVEILNGYGVAPSYGLFRWDTSPMYGASGERKGGRWTTVEAGKCGIMLMSGEETYRWRPYAGDPTAYSDPTGGAQDHASYWRGAAAAKYGFPLDFFEANVAASLSARDASPEERRWLDVQPVKPWWRRLLGL